MKTAVFISVFILFLITGTCSVYAAELSDDIDYENIQEMMDSEKSLENIDFKGTVKSLMEEDDAFSAGSIAEKVLNSVETDFKSGLTVLSTIISLILILAVFKNISTTFRNGQVSEIGFYATYLVLFANIGLTVYTACNLAVETINLVLDFMKVLIPAYSLTVTVASGAGTSAVLYEGVLILITVCEMFMLNIVIPLINVYILLMLAGRINNGNSLSKLGEMIISIVGWSQKALLGLVLGIGAVKSLLTPSIDNVRRSSLIKLTSLIPGIGNAISGVTETVLGAASLVKNAVGTAGIIILVVICLIPLAKILLYVICYKLGAAIVQPVSDTRILECLNDAASATMLLFRTVGTCLLLFLLTIAVTASATNR